MLVTDPADNVIRIGPRKLCRVIRYATNSTVTRQPGDYSTHSDRVHEPSPITIRGDTSQREAINPGQESNSETPSSNITSPSSMNNASTANSSKTPAVADRQMDAPVERPSSNAAPIRRDTILLVEDNVINMRVSLLHSGCEARSLRCRY